MSQPNLFPKRPVQALVIVDSRNVHGQVRDLFGHGRQISVGGVVEMLTGYGFQVDEVWVAIATQGDARHGSKFYADSLVRNGEYASRIVSDPRGHVLEGRLVQRGPHVEEKLVDVLCAIQVARLSHDIAAKRRDGVIIVMSEDMDLIPSYEFAEELGVTVYATSNDRVDTRATYSRWLLVPEGSMAKSCGRVFGRFQGSELRRYIARLLTQTSAPTVNFKAGGVDPKTRQVFLQHNSGATAVWHHPPVAYQHHRGSVETLTVHGCDFEHGPFPRLVLGDKAPASWPPPGLIKGEVLAWKTPTRASVRMGAVTKTLEMPPGTVLPGMLVLAHHASAGAQEAWRFVGPLDTRAASPGWTDPTCPVVVRVISTAGTAGARVRAKILATGQEITLQPPSEDRAQAGMEYAAVPVEHMDAGGETHVLAMAVSSQLR